MCDSNYHKTHSKAFKTYLNTASALHIFSKMWRCL